MKSLAIVFLFFGIILAAPISLNEHLAVRTEPVPDNDDWVVYPDVDRDEDVVYAYHAINDK
ncbi:hypothetical protein GRF29_77g44419 [Pseudopithomyces chartarum]|uniref:Uncharacterized protein n=1 Tax=Pseudopithomyces chartarum TaxID=1892770 RepID=A0AAN6LYY0_9PLEO|nr:hypothetical protein GRF29_77g44419 [Pseudopithomyces chartarum]